MRYHQDQHAVTLRVTVQEDRLAAMQAAIEQADGTAVPRRPAMVARTTPGVPMFLAPPTGSTEDPCVFLRMRSARLHALRGPNAKSSLKSADLSHRVHEVTPDERPSFCRLLSTALPASIRGRCCAEHATLEAAIEGVHHFVNELVCSL